MYDFSQWEHHRSPTRLIESLLQIPRCLNIHILHNVSHPSSLMQLNQTKVGQVPPDPECAAYMCIARGIKLIHLPCHQTLPSILWCSSVAAMITAYSVAHAHSLLPAWLPQLSSAPFSAFVNVTVIHDLMSSLILMPQIFPFPPYSLSLAAPPLPLR